MSRQRLLDRMSRAADCRPRATTAPTLAGRPDPGRRPGRGRAPAGAPAHRDAADATQGRPRTKAAQREATVAALIAAARELFAEHGYAGVGTEEIVQRAGVTRGALYHHFRGGKLDLFQAVLVEVSAEVVRTVVEVATAQDDPWEELVEGVEAFLDACARPEVQRIMLIDGPSVLGWEVWRAADGDYALSLLESALQGAIDAGRLIPQPARALAHVLLGAIDEAAMVVARVRGPGRPRGRRWASRSGGCSRG